MMKLEIFDVGHGACSVVTCPNGARIMVDCGRRLWLPWFPSVAFNGERIALLTLSNLDEDHVADLPFLERVDSLLTNPTVTSEALESMKAEAGMGPGISHLNVLLKALGPGFHGHLGDLAGVEIRPYCNRYSVDFTDTNNLSVVTCVSFGAFKVLFSGDLEVEGWRSLLRRPSFVADLAGVNMFVASHHGRSNGCCGEVFQFCHPDVFVFSDGEVRFGSQQTTDWYGWRARGIWDFTRPPDPIFGYHRRRVLTTRADGTLTTYVSPFGQYLVLPERRRVEYLQERSFI